MNDKAKKLLEGVDSTQLFLAAITGLVNFYGTNIAMKEAPTQIIEYATRFVEEVKGKGC